MRFTLPTLKQNLLYFFGIVLFIANVLMFDYLSWDIWWVPIVQGIVAVLILWIAIVFIKEKKKNKPEISKE